MCTQRSRFNKTNNSYEEIGRELNPTPSGKISSGLAWASPKIFDINENYTKVKVEYQCHYEFPNETKIVTTTEEISTEEISTSCDYVKIYARHNGEMKLGVLYARNSQSEFKPVKKLYQRKSTGMERIK